MGKKKIKTNKNKGQILKPLKPHDKNYTNKLDLQFLSCYNHTKERNKQEEHKKTLNIKNLKHYKQRIFETAQIILNNPNNKNNIKTENNSIPLNIHNAFLHFSQLCMDHFEFSDVSKIVQKNINEFENEQLKNEKIKNEKLKQTSLKNNKRNVLKLDLNNTTKNKIKSINNLLLQKPKKHKKITDFLEVKTIKKCQTFPIQIRK